MQTFTGRAFPLLNPTPADIDSEDIAHALSLICRYGGHVSRFYSVAEHCVLMSYAVPAEHALWALLHDATEAYLGDVISPLKHHLPEYRVVENRLMHAVIKRFSLPDAMPDRVAGADMRILHDERAALLGPTPRPWMPSLEALPPLGVTIHGWAPDEAEMQYLSRLIELTS